MCIAFDAMYNIKINCFTPLKHGMGRGVWTRKTPVSMHEDLHWRKKIFSSISWYIYMNYSNPDKAVKRSLKVVHGSIIVSFMCTTNPLPFFYLHYKCLQTCYGYEYSINTTHIWNMYYSQRRNTTHLWKIIKWE